MATKLSVNIRELRKSHNLTQSELGRRLHKAGSTVRMWELDKSSPDGETLMALSRIFNVSTDYLLSNDKSAEPVDDLIQETPLENKQITKINKDLTRLNQKQLKLVGDLVREISRSDNE